MDLLLLAAGAVVLIGITLWIVWPARTADSPGNSVQGEEVSERPMAETVTSAIPPQGDRFEDQYTSATADLSAGAVAASVESMQAESNLPPAPLPEREPSRGLPGLTLTTTTPALPAPSRTTSLLARRRGVGLGVGALLAASGGVAGAYVYARWQRERNKPINRLRRSARAMAGRLGERIPDIDELPLGPAPMSGAATALLLSGIVASRTLRREAAGPMRDPRDRAEGILRESAEEALGLGRDAVRRGRKESRRLSSRIPSDSMDGARRSPLVARIGFGGLALIGGAAFVIWRLVHRAQPDRTTWYAGE